MQMLKVFNLIFVICSLLTCINSQVEEIMVAKAAIETIESTAKLANDLAIKAQPGNACFQNGDCYPINVFDNLCCVKNGFIGQCCNMFSYISERP